MTSYTPQNDRYCFVYVGAFDSFHFGSTLHHLTKQTVSIEMGHVTICLVVDQDIADNDCTRQDEVYVDTVLYLF